MAFTLEFLRIFGVGLVLICPVLLFLGLVIVALGQLIGRRESWTKSDSFYYSFITATTVGYGDFRPAKRFCKMAAIGIAFSGLLLTGIVVAVGLEAVHQAFINTGNVEQARERFVRTIDRPNSSADSD